MDLIKQNCSKHGFKHTDYHLIITDLRMKPVDGYQLSQMVRNYLIDCKLNQPLIALCTGDNSQMDETICNKYGINMILNKPVDVKILKELLKMTGYI